MKYAVVSVSAAGAQLGRKVRDILGGDGTLYERKGSGSGADAVCFTRTLSLTAEIFSEYDAILYIMAAGIAVRAIAPHVASKTSDPAVVVMDECGIHCISILSGHLGGANAWAREIAEAVGADPVITTATDVHRKPAPDDIARQLHMKVEPVSALRPVNSAVAEGKRMIWFVDEALPDAEDIRHVLQKWNVESVPCSDTERPDYDAAAVISDRPLKFRGPFVYLRPRCLHLGIGCRRGTPENMIRDAVQQALAAVGVPISRVAGIGSVTVKKEEEGLLLFAQHLGVPIQFYTPEEMKECIDRYHLEESEFVKKEIGVGNICETAAILQAGQGKVLLRKTKYPHVTVAVAAEKSR